MWIMKTEVGMGALGFIEKSIEKVTSRVSEGSNKS